MGKASRGKWIRRLQELESALLVKQPLWDKRTTVFLCAELFVGILLTVVAAMKGDLRWLLWFAGLVALHPIWILSQYVPFKRASGKIAIFVASMALVSLGLYGLNSWLDPNEQQTIAPRMVEVGTRGMNVYAIVDASKVSQEFKDRFSLIVVARAGDATIDAENDTVIEKSNLFKIPENQVRIELPDVSQANMLRLFRMQQRSIDSSMMEIYLLCVPNSIGPDKFSTMAEAKSKRGIQCDSKAFLWPRANANLLK